MAGNSSRRGAVRKPGSKKGAVKGTGGHGRNKLEGRGPTPKAEDRPHHPAARQKMLADRATAKHGNPGRRPGRTKDATEYVYGRNSVVEALTSGVPAVSVEIADRVETDDRIRSILAQAAERGLPVMRVTRQELDRRFDAKVHQGVVLRIPPYKYREPRDLLDVAAASESPALIVALDSITDPHNVGAVLRSASAFGAHGVVIPERRAAGVTAAAWKVSAGAAARVPVAKAPNLVRALEEYASAGCFIVGLAGDGDTAIADIPVADRPLVLVTGSEGDGLSRLVRQACDVVASIPISAGMESLNASVATGIALYEVARLRRCM